MFVDKFFTIKEHRESEYSAEFDVEICAKHPIFDGHFPGDPITPGVCILQMACDLFSHLKQQEFFISAVKNAKFMHVIRPLETPGVTFQISYQLSENQMDYDLKCVVSHEDTTFAKISFTASTIKI